MSLDFRADLHCHSTYSDGTYSPERLIELAVFKNLKGLSITDHDTLGAYTQAFALAEQSDISLIPGVEFSAVYNQVSIHILAYSFFLNSPVIIEFCKSHELKRKARNQNILRLLTKRGMPIFEHELQTLEKTSTVGRPHIALAMIKKGYVSSLQEAFQLYIGEGKPCYEPGEKFSVEETIQVIHEAKGVAILAHPHLIKESRSTKSLFDLNFDGLEGYYGRFGREKNERWVKIAKQKKWLITGGSDFHGDIKPMLSLGDSWVGKEEFSILLDLFKKNQK